VPPGDGAAGVLTPPGVAVPPPGFTGAVLLPLDAALPELLPCFDPELSQAASESADNTASATSHFRSIVPPIGRGSPLRR
jgi:hypothetical protein